MKKYNRRQFIQTGSAAAATAALGGSLVACGESSSLKSGANNSQTEEWPRITPNDDFYLTQVEILDRIEPAEWRLDVAGMVREPVTLDYDQVLAMEAEEHITTLTCIGGSVGTSLIGTAKWRGVRMDRLLDEWGVSDDAIDMIAGDGEGYTDSIPVSWIRENLVLLVTHMNDEPLPHVHGFPARIIVPGLYGIKNIKWLREIEFVDYDYRGYWQNRGNWSETAIVKIISQIANVWDGFQATTGPLTVTGFAFAGLRGIQRVEVSADDGETWADAIMEPALSPYAWTPWSADLTFEEPGEHVLVVRATDGEGKVQDEEVQDRLQGSEGWHKVTINVS